MNYRVQKKLLANTSVECQVNELIQIATDPKNLSRMFSGWQGKACLEMISSVVLIVLTCYLIIVKNIISTIIIENHI